MRHQLLSYADDVNIAAENVGTLKKNTEAVSDADKEIDMKVNAEKLGVPVSRYQKAGHKHSVKAANRSFEGVAKFKYLGTTPEDQNFMHEEIKSRLNSGNACYHFVQSLFFFPVSV
jgi:hypothetical protein